MSTLTQNCGKIYIGCSCAPGRISMPITGLFDNVSLFFRIEGLSVFCSPMKRGTNNGKACSLQDLMSLFFAALFTLLDWATVFYSYGSTVPQRMPNSDNRHCSIAVLEQSKVGVAKNRFRAKQLISTPRAKQFISTLAFVMQSEATIYLVFLCLFDQKPRMKWST